MENYSAFIEEVKNTELGKCKNNNWKKLKSIDSELIKQYLAFKEENQEHLIFFQVGDFFELYSDDAVIASEVLGMKLTKREIGGQVIPMCGMPQKSGNDFANRLAKEGYFVSLIVQEKNENGEVKRKFLESITPATIDSDLAEKDQNQFIMTAYEFKKEVGVVLFDPLTGEVQTRLTNPLTGELESKLTNRYGGIFDLIERFSPKEIQIYLPILWEEELLNKLKRIPNCKIYHVPRFYDEMAAVIEEHKKEHFNNEFESYSIIAAHYFMLQYIKKVQIKHVTLRPIQYINERDYLFLHKTAINGLDILENSQSKKKKGSLFDLLDLCVTSKGSRTLKSWLQEPLLNPVEIEKRLRFVEQFVQNSELRQKLRECLEGTPDVERILGRLENGRFKETDLVLLKNGMEKSGLFLQTVMGNTKFDALERISKGYFNKNKLILEQLQTRIDDEEIIVKGYDSTYDHIKETKEKGIALLEEYGEKINIKFKTKQIKLKENRVLGYFFEITNNQLTQINNNLTGEEIDEFNTLFVERGKVSNALRFVTEELKMLEEEFYNAQQEFDSLYRKTIRKIAVEILPCHTEIKEIIDFVGTFDVLLSFSQISCENGYVKPVIESKNNIMIKAGKHPLLQKFSYKITIPNDAIVKSQNAYLITGPNMGGKSSYLKMVGLLIVMAQVGCFVPAEKMLFTPVDRILLRMGASDSLLEAQSTFAMEMDEVSYILFHATENSLVLMDELGRGTSTTDGIAIAASVIEELHNKLKPKMICSTHYHELIKLEDKLERFTNLHAEAKKDNYGNVNLTYKIINGGSPNSFGIEVAKKSGIPNKIIERAQEILNDNSLL